MRQRDEATTTGLPCDTFVINSVFRVETGGWGEIRTHGTLAGTPVFKTGALNRSATHPLGEIKRMELPVSRTDSGLAPNWQQRVSGSTECGEGGFNRGRCIRESYSGPSINALCVWLFGPVASPSRSASAASRMRLRRDPPRTCARLRALL